MVVANSIETSWRVLPQVWFHMPRQQVPVNFSPQWIQLPASQKPQQIRYRIAALMVLLVSEISTQMVFAYCWHYLIPHSLPPWCTRTHALVHIRTECFHIPWMPRYSRVHPAAMTSNGHVQGVSRKHSCRCTTISFSLSVQLRPVESPRLRYFLAGPAQGTDWCCYRYV